MITSADLRERVKREPFAPFRIRTSSGTCYDVMHPEFIIVGKRVVGVGKPLQPNDEEFDLLQQVSILHITALEPLEASQASST
jgi:hypothetical protein